MKPKGDKQRFSDRVEVRQVTTGKVHGSIVWFAS